MVLASLEKKFLLRHLTSASTSQLSPVHRVERARGETST
jgi:hypothetical protein